MRPKKIVIWGAWYGSRNVGDQALLLSIADALGDRVPIRYTVLTDDPKHVAAYTRQESQANFYPLSSRRQFPKLVWEMATADLFVFGGGVPFFATRKHLAVMSLLVAIARFFRTPYMAWAVSSQAVDAPVAMRIFRWVLNGAYAVTCRDRQTLELFQRCGVTRPIHLVADPVFLMRCEEHPGVQNARPLIALTPRFLRAQDGEAETHYQPVEASQYQLKVSCFAAVLDWAWERGLQPIFIPMNTLAPDDDLAAARDIIAHARHGKYALTIDTEIRPRTAPAVYAACKWSFVARLHGSIISTLGRCPAMMYAFGPKHVGIMESMGLPEFSLHPAHATPESAVQMAAKLDATVEDLRRNIDNLTVQQRERASLPVKLVNEILLPR